MGALTTLICASSAIGSPRTGATIPAFSATDLVGQSHHIAEMRGRPTLLIAITSREAGTPASDWSDRVRARFGSARVRLITAVSLDLNGMLPMSFVRGAARDRTPRAYWHTTWLERSGSIRNALGLARSDGVPYVMALDRNGVVRAMVHSGYNSHAAQTIFSVLEGSRPREEVGTAEH